ncbi:hypothetical protein LA52FAK_31930 [Desulforhopalus sp. 52FAK]
MRAVLDELVGKGEGIEAGRMLYTIGDFQFPTLGALGIELSRLPELFTLIKRFGRAPILCDKTWLRRLANLREC